MNGLQAATQQVITRRGYTQCAKTSALAKFCPMHDHKLRP